MDRRRDQTHASPTPGAVISEEDQALDEAEAFRELATSDALVAADHLCEDEEGRRSSCGHVRGVAYHQPICRPTAPGYGGQPQKLRPTSAPCVGRSRGDKLERWREAGQQRWPMRAQEEREKRPTQFYKAEEVVPERRAGMLRSEMAGRQEGWSNELWMRSLRAAGVPVQDALYNKLGAEIKNIHEEWAKKPQPSPWQPRPRSTNPYGGSTARGCCALSRPNNQKDWIERPVAVGTVALDHMGGGRYHFDQTPRGLEYSKQGLMPKTGLRLPFKVPDPDWIREGRPKRSSRRPHSAR